MARSLVLGELQDTYNRLLYVNITSLKLEFDMKCYVNNIATIFSEFRDAKFVINVANYIIFLLY